MRGVRHATRRHWAFAAAAAGARARRHAEVPLTPTPPAPPPPSSSSSSSGDDRASGGGGTAAAATYHRPPTAAETSSRGGGGGGAADDTLPLPIGSRRRAAAAPPLQPMPPAELPPWRRSQSSPSPQLAPRSRRRRFVAQSHREVRYAIMGGVFAGLDPPLLVEDAACTPPQLPRELL